MSRGSNEATPGTVHARFVDACYHFWEESGHEATQCTLSVDVARTAAWEHRHNRRRMFQYWHPTMQFVVDLKALPHTLIVSRPP